VNVAAVKFRMKLEAIGSVNIDVLSLVEINLTNMVFPMYHVDDVVIFTPCCSMLLPN
jgi:hypothetical protein